MKAQVIDWACNRMPQIILQSEQITDVYQTLLVNCSSILNQLLRQKAQDANIQLSQLATTNQQVLIDEFLQRLDQILQALQPQSLIVLSIDGVLPLNKVKSMSKLSPTEQFKYLLLPGSALSKKIHESLVEFSKKHLALNNQMDFILLGSDMPGEALFKIRQLVSSQKNKPGFSIEQKMAIVDDLSDQTLMTAFSLHLPNIHLAQIAEKTSNTAVAAAQMKSSQVKTQNVPISSVLSQFIDVGLMRQLVITEFSLLNHQGTRDYEAIIDDLVLLSLLCGSDSLPQLTFFKSSNMESFFYLYKRMYPFLNGSLSSNGVIYQTNLHLFFHELGVIEDSVVLNEYRSQKIANRQDSKSAQKHLRDLVKQVVDNQILSMEKSSQVNSKAGQENPENSLATYKSFFTGNKGQQIAERCLKKAESGYENSLADVNKYGERFFEGICEDDSDDDIASISEKLLPGEPGFKDQFYKSSGKCQDNNLSALRIQLAQKYFEGIVWHFASYYREYPSWLWEYNYDFAPFAEDMRVLSELQISFFRSSPFTNAQQMILLFPHTPSSSLPTDLSQHVFGGSSTLADLFPTAYSTGQLDFKSLPSSEIERLLLALLAIPQFISFSQEVDRIQKYPILIANANKFSDIVIALPQGSEENSCQTTEQNKDGLKQLSKQGSLLSIEKHGVSGEVCSVIKSENDSTIQSVEIDIMSVRLPIVPCPSAFLPLPEAKKQFLLDAVSSIHNRAHCNNPRIQALERSLGISVDSNEIFNKGISSQILYPIPKVVTVPSSVSSQKSSNSNANGNSNNNNSNNTFQNSSRQSRINNPNNSNNNNYSGNFNNNYSNQHDQYPHSNSNNMHNKSNNNRNNNNNNSNNNFPNGRNSQQFFVNSSYQNPPYGNNNNNGRYDSGYDNYGNRDHYDNNQYDSYGDGPGYGYGRNNQQFRNQNQFYNNDFDRDQGDFRGNNRNGNNNYYQNRDQNNFQGGKRSHPDNRFNQSSNYGRKQFQSNYK